MNERPWALVNHIKEREDWTERAVKELKRATPRLREADSLRESQDRARAEVEEMCRERVELRITTEKLESRCVALEKENEVEKRSGDAQRDRDKQFADLRKKVPDAQTLATQKKMSDRLDRVVDERNTLRDRVEVMDGQLAVLSQQLD